MKTILIIAATFAVLVILLLAAAAYALRSAFAKRCDGNPSLKYFTSDDFEGLMRRDVEFPSDKGQLLRGAVYTYEAVTKPLGLVIFAHGMGGGHLSYMTEINTIARAGFKVLSYDNTGTMSSEGGSLVGFYQSVRDLESAVKFASGDSELSGYKAVLVGHSWGGYASCCASCKVKDKISGVVAFSAPESAAGAAVDSVGMSSGLKLSFLKPLFSIASVIVNGFDSRRSASDSLIAVGNIPILLLHGDCDPSVSMKNSPVSNKALTSRENVSVIVCHGRAHNVYQTERSEKYLDEVFGKISAAAKKYGKSGIPEAEKSKLYDIDYALITEEDSEIMKTAVDFMIRAVKTQK